MFDINNYTEKTKTVTVTDPNGLITIGDDFNGGQFVDIFSATGLVVKKDGVTLVNGKNFTLPTADKLIKEQYGQNFYSQIQMLGTTGVLTITYRCYGKYVSEEITLRHETRLNEHDTAITSVQNSVTNVESTVSGLDSRVTNTESAVEAAQSSIDTVTTDLGIAQSAITEAQADIDSLQANALLKTDNSFGSLTVSTPTDGAKFVFQDETTGAIVTCSKSSLTAASGAGTGNVTGPSTSVVDEIATFNNTTGTLIKSSGKKIGNASGNVPLANGTKCVNLYSELAGKSLMLDSLPMATATPDILTQAWILGAGTRFSYNTDVTPSLANLPTNRPQYGQLEVYGTSNDVIKVFLRDTMSLATWIINKTAVGNGTWTQLTDASGNAINANSLGGVAAAFYPGFIGNGTTLQDGAMANDTNYTAEQSGHITISVSATNAFITIAGRTVTFESNVPGLIHTYPIKAGQTFRVSTTNFSSASFFIKGALS